MVKFKNILCVIKGNAVKRFVIFILLLSVLPLAVSADSLINRESSPVQVFLEAEQGTLLVAYHTIQIGKDNDPFNYRTQGGQEILFPFARYQAGLTISDRHLVSLLYQPLTIVTKVPFRDSVTMDDVPFDGSDNPMELTYGFPFYRLTYGYNLLRGDQAQLYVGAVLQLRNASIIFSEIGGEQIAVSQNLGPVPALFAQGRYVFPSGLTLMGEATGIFASSAFINGADFTFEGSLLDASLRAGYLLESGMEMFFNLRFLGGSAKGESEYDNAAWSKSKEQFTANYLGTVSASIGVTLR